ncbi:hypothetical protein HBA55_01710 [Pseudomaricurvus alkylphenolicus]|uniref:hypothetical protein n=1 Tax=Pseudomaricurvus alkylphenolicus TaxID=1306991 RepID=UPI0014216BBE|nr:hypothetical protein [Pseudomaricurvus alkylphenolicus]NIB38279.1 hypothetical protein [Pseudomaricurvus alkylphenolicus]
MCKRNTRILATLLSIILLGLATLTSANTIPMGNTHLDTQTPTFIEFNPPQLPAGFFAPNPNFADPFFGPFSPPLIELEGLGDPDTIVRRKEDIVLSNIGDTATVDIEIVALSLRSVEPFQVDVGGQTQDWMLDITLPSSVPQPLGQMTIERTSNEGGTFLATLPVMPLLVFTRQSDNEQLFHDQSTFLLQTAFPANWFGLDEGIFFPEPFALTNGIPNSGSPGGFDPPSQMPFVFHSVEPVSLPSTIVLLVLGLLMVRPRSKRSAISK